MIKRLGLLLVVSLLLSSLTVPFAQEAPRREEDESTIGQDMIIKKGDEISITVWRHNDLTQKVVVDDAGNITYPLLGELKVEGLTVAELKEYLTYLLGKDYIVDPFVTVTVEKSKEEKQFYVYGEVRQPGAYKMEARLTVLKAITLAGGLTDYASHIVYIKRKINGKEKRIRVNINNVIRNVEVDVPICPEDIVVVTRRVF